MAGEHTTGAFTNVDAAYLDTVRALDSIQTVKNRAFKLLDIQQGFRILDVGCGTGDDVLALARLVRKGGSVVGIDSSETMITEAKKRTEGLNLPVEYRLGDAHTLAFTDNTFDGCRADRVFFHLENPRKALTEMIRVAQRGARIVVFEIDWETLVIPHPDRTLTRKVLNFLCDSFPNGWMGRQLPALFDECGLIDIVVIPETPPLTNFTLAKRIFRFHEVVEDAQRAAVISTAEAAKWLDLLEKVGQSGHFFSAATGFIVSGRKP